MQQLLAKYIYKNYYELLKNDKINLDLARLGWVKPAVIPRQTVLYENRLIRKYLTGTLDGLYHDLEFQRILCRVGYYGPACTTTSTTTTTTTTVLPWVSLTNNTPDQMLSLTFNGVTPPWANTPIILNGHRAGTLAAGTYTVASFLIVDTVASFMRITDSDGTVHCQSTVGGGTKTFPNIVLDNTTPITIELSNGAC